MPIGQPVDETRFVLDTDVLTDWRYGKPHIKQAIDDYRSRLKRPPGLTAINVFEALKGFEEEDVKRGAGDERRKQDRDKTEKLISECLFLPFNASAAEIAAYIFPRISRSERNKHWCDVFIAATALAHGYGVATRNRSDFELIGNVLPQTQFLRLAVWKP